MRHLLAIVVASLAFGLAACGDDKTSSVTKRDNGAAEAMNMPEDFPNVAHKCDGHGHRVYVSNNTETGAGAIAAIDDTTCGGP